MKLIEEKANEVCSVLHNKGYGYAFNPLIIISVISVIVQLIKIFISLYGKDKLLDKFKVPGLLSNIRIRRKIAQEVRKLKEHYEPGLEHNVEVGIRVMFGKLTQDELERMIKEGKIK